jgi:hypothetical protein
MRSSHNKPEQYGNAICSFRFQNSGDIVFMIGASFTAQNSSWTQTFRCEKTVKSQIQRILTYSLSKPNTEEQSEYDNNVRPRFPEDHQTRKLICAFERTYIVGLSYVCLRMDRSKNGLEK